MFQLKNLRLSFATQNGKTPLQHFSPIPTIVKFPCFFEDKAIGDLMAKLLALKQTSVHDYNDKFKKLLGSIHLVENDVVSFLCVGLMLQL